ncbi:hypothetical protein ACQR35_00460 [Pseudarthrobacter sp. J1738]|uniref:hypothetical protein n=1 Tax=unclassified Pseudarthrobacter TaxID=2647000 RepID=UPI003D275F1B
MENDSVGSMPALSMIDGGRERAMPNVGSPWWYYPVFGVTFAGAELVIALGQPIFVSFLGIATLVIGSLAARGYKRARGAFVGGFRSGSAVMWLTIGFLLIMLPSMFSGAFLVKNVGQPWPAWVRAAIVLIENLGYGYLVDRAVHRKLSLAMA